MTYYEDLPRAEQLAVCDKQNARQAEQLRENDRKAKAVYDARKAKYDALRVPMFTVDAEGVHEVMPEVAE